MNKFHLSFFIVLAATLSFGQIKLKKDSFLVSGLATNYKEIISTHKWKRIADYSMSAGTIRYFEFEPDLLIYERGPMYARIKGKKIISKGDLLLKEKILFVSSSTVILEYRSVVTGRKRYRSFYRVSS